mgnify:CR=1 FL=1
MPDSTKKSLRRCLGLFLCASCQVLLPGRFQANVQHCTWLGSPMCAAGGGSSTWGNAWESRTLPDSMKKGLTPYGVGSFFIPSATFLLSGRLQSMCTLYLVRIFSAARCAGFRQEKSPGRVGRCRIPQRNASADVWGFFFLHPVRSFFQVVFKPTSNLVLG